MSRAFVRERDGEEPPEAPAETPVSEHRNLVTRRGQSLLEAELARLELALADAATVRATSARLARDRRYVLRRLSSAEVVETAQAGAGEPVRVAFGNAVTLALADGRTVTWRIVGEDEADPANGRIAWVAPVAAKLVGLAAGDEVVLPAGTAEVIAVDPTPEPVVDAPASRGEGGRG
jgi:transcription elongation GreA/GreB family factor